MSSSTAFLSAVGERGSTLQFEGSNFFRMRLELSVLSGRAITIGKHCQFQSVKYPQDLNHLMVLAKIICTNA